MKLLISFTNVSFSCRVTTLLTMQGHLDKFDQSDHMKLNNKGDIGVMVACILGDPGAVSRVGRKAGRTFSSMGKRAPGYRLSPNYFQKFKLMLAPDWAQKMLCIIVPNPAGVLPRILDRGVP